MSGGESSASRGTSTASGGWDRGAGDSPLQWPIQFVVERGKCLELARVLRAHDAAYLDAPRLTAVPTFPVVANHWGFSGADVLRELGCEMTRVLHGAERFEYPNGPLLEGQRLAGAMRLCSREQRQTRDGRPMTALTLETELRDADSGALAVRVRRTILELVPREGR